MTDIDDRHPHCLKDSGRKALHIASENDEVRLPVDEVEYLRLGLGLVRAFRRNMVEGYAEETVFLLLIPMVRDHHGDLDVQLAPLMPPQQFEQAVIGLRREDDHVLRGSLVDEFPVEAEFGKRRGQVLFEAGKRLLEILDLEQEPLMESRLLPLAEELIALDDVSLVTCNKGADSGDDASALGSGHDQARTVESVRKHRHQPRTDNLVSSRPWRRGHRMCRNGAAHRRRSPERTPRQHVR